MALAASTDSAAGAMADAAVEQGAAEDLGGGGEGGSEFGAGIEDRRWFCQSLPEHFFQFCFGVRRIQVAPKSLLHRRPAIARATSPGAGSKGGEGAALIRLSRLSAGL